MFVKGYCENMFSTLSLRHPIDNRSPAAYNEA